VRRPAIASIRCAKYESFMTPSAAELRYSARVPFDRIVGLQPALRLIKRLVVCSALVGNIPALAVDKSGCQIRPYCAEDTAKATLGVKINTGFWRPGWNIGGGHVSTDEASEMRPSANDCTFNSFSDSHELNSVLPCEHIYEVSNVSPSLTTA
jgi:hypothetical protein